MMRRERHLARVSYLIVAAASLFACVMATSEAVRVTGLERASRPGLVSARPAQFALFAQGPRHKGPYRYHRSAPRRVLARRARAMLSFARFQPSPRTALEAKNRAIPRLLQADTYRYGAPRQTLPHLHFFDKLSAHTALLVHVVGLPPFALPPWTAESASPRYVNSPRLFGIC